LQDCLFSGKNHQCHLNSSQTIMIRAYFRVNGFPRYRDFSTDDAELARLDFVDWWVDNDVNVTSAVLFFRVAEKQLEKVLGKSTAMV
jgi:hypothetical protein